MAMTLDGRTIRPDGKWYGLTSGADRRRMDRIRLESAGVLTGTGTILADDPIQYVRNGDGSIHPESPAPVLIFHRRMVPVNYRVYRGPRKPIVFISRELVESMGIDELYRLESHCEAIHRTEVEFSLARVLETLSNAHGFKTLLLEGGPTFNHLFFSQDLVDRVYLTLVPHIIGQSGLFTIAEGEGAIPGFDQKKWKLTTCETVEGEVHLTYDRFREGDERFESRKLEDGQELADLHLGALRNEDLF